MYEVHYYFCTRAKIKMISCCSKSWKFSSGKVLFLKLMYITLLYILLYLYYYKLLLLSTEGKVDRQQTKKLTYID